MTDHTQLEMQRLTNSLDQLSQENDLLHDVVRAAQRLYDEIHLAGTTEVTVAGPVINNERRPGTYGFTITTNNRGIADALANLSDALKNLYTPGGNH